MALASLAEAAGLALANAPTERCAAVLLDQVNGSLERAIRQAIDADDETALDSINELLGKEQLGLHLSKPWRIVLAGPPNVGKSSLINALVGYGRALVYDQPGTTRDVVTASTAIAGWPVTLADTAGVRETEDPLEAAGVEQARETLRTAEVAILVREAASLAEPDCLQTCEAIRAELPGDASVIEVASKADLADQPPPAGLVATAVPTGQGVGELIAAIERAIEPTSLARGEAVPFQAWHYDTLRAAASASSQAERRRFLLALLAGGRL